MTKISRFKVDSRHLGFFINNFWNLITLLENKEQVANFLKDLLTHTEMKMFAKRIQVAKMLMEGSDYRSIRNYVKVSDATIATINNKLENGSEGLKTAIKYFKKVEKDIEGERFRITPDLKKRYGEYFLLDKVIDKAGKQVRAHNKKQSIKKDISL